MASNTYDELGRLQTKNLGGADVTTYTYNVRSWITGISGNKFTENLYYGNGYFSGDSPSFNGNIVSMQWNVANDNLNYNRAYSFIYDGLNRLTNANYYGISNGNVVSGTLGRYNEVIDYQNDKMGNIHGITRYENGTQVENINLQYQGNQLKKADNAINHFISYGSELFNDSVNSSIQNEYAYDNNGNMLYDSNGEVSAIQYNLLNLPDKIHFTVGHKNLYTYNAGGQKLRAVNYTTHQMVNIPLGTITPLSSTPSDYTVLTTDYVGNIIYENGTLKQIMLPDGYWQNGVFYYYLKDHLGSNRVTINSSGAIVEKSHYYPSGTRFNTESTNNSNALAYRYNGKEMETMNGLNQMDYGARRRFSWNPSWTAVDPLAEKYYSISPYAYCGGNPVNRFDPDGMDWFQNTLTGEVFYNSNLHQGAESSMADGWQWMGENEMFKKDKYDIDNSDWMLAGKNGGDFQFKVNNPLNKYDDEMVISMFLNKEKATKFMDVLGYEKKPLVADVFSSETNRSLPEPNGPIWLTDPYETIEKVYSWTYAKEEIVGSYKVLGYYGKRQQTTQNLSEMSWTRKNWERRIYDYSKPSNSMAPLMKLGFEIMKYTWDIIDLFKTKK